MNKRGFTMAWAPAPAKQLPTPFMGRGGAMGQQPKIEHDNKITAAAIDAAVGFGSAYLAWLLTRADNRWSTFWWVVTGISTIKLLHDVSRP
jgi:hypothetical protein